MRHRVKGAILDREKGPRESLLRNLVTNMVLREKIKTTRAKAKAMQPLVEQAITLAKTGTLAARRRLAGMMFTELAQKKVFEDLGKRFKDRTGGYTRITALGERLGDSAEMVQIEFV